MPTPMQPSRKTSGPSRHVPEQCGPELWAADVPSYLSAHWEPGWPSAWRVEGGAADRRPLVNQGRADAKPSAVSPLMTDSSALPGTAAPYHTARGGGGADENTDPNAAPASRAQSATLDTERAAACCLDQLYQAAGVQKRTVRPDAAPQLGASLSSPATTLSGHGADTPCSSAARSCVRPTAGLVTSAATCACPVAAAPRSSAAPPGPAAASPPISNHLAAVSNNSAAVASLAACTLPDSSPPGAVSGGSCVGSSIQSKQAMPGGPGPVVVEAALEKVAAVGRTCQAQYAGRHACTSVSSLRSSGPPALRSASLVMQLVPLRSLSSLKGNNTAFVRPWVLLLHCVYFDSFAGQLNPGLVSVALPVFCIPLESEQKPRTHYKPWRCSQFFHQAHWATSWSMLREIACVGRTAGAAEVLLEDLCGQGQAAEAQLQAARCAYC